MMRVARAVITGTVGAFVAACDAPMAPTAPSVVATMTASATSISVGDSVVLRMVVRNTLPSIATFEVGVGTTAFDVAIMDTAGQEVWRRSSQPKVLPSTYLSIGARDSTAFTFVLHVGTVGGVALAPGRYRLSSAFIDLRSDIIGAANPLIDIAVVAVP